MDSQILRLNMTIKNHLARGDFLLQLSVYFNKVVVIGAKSSDSAMVIVKGVDKEGTSDPGYSPTVLEHLLQLAEETRDIAEGVRDDADAGKFDGYTPRRGVDYWTTSDQNTILTKTRSQSKVTAYENIYR